MKRINVVGTSGSGKSTFSRQLASSLGYQYIEMDAIFWKPNWQEPTDEEFFSALEGKLASDTWVLDGNYNRTGSVKWSRVDTVIWIDYSFARTIYQAVKRALVRSINQQELWENTGNVESFKKSFFSKDSIILWTLKTYKSNRARYQRLLANADYGHIKFVRITSPKEARAYIKALGV
ncbi:adenylate kinase [Vibrio sp. WXL103]|uniref:adenylate kinase n=1 Tax=Vibrio sp. WXL103 TaxID=3450710 RepID=UPI003EC59638